MAFLKGKLIHGMMILKNHHINKRIVVFESDDWGSTRMPSLETLGYLQSKGIGICRPDDYDKVDTLASNTDLEYLIDTLSSVKDSKGNPAKITLNTCVANPDFARIEKSGFTEYYYEPFTETLKKYPRHDKSFAYWKEGIDKMVFKPQFHGREHLNFQKWIRYMRNNNEAVKECCKQGVISLFINDNGRRETFLDAYNIVSSDERKGVSKSIEDGLTLFNDIFGFKSESIIAPCYTWDNYIEDIAFKSGIKYIQGGYIQHHSVFQGSIGKLFSGRYFGETNKNGQKYLIRNCTFEPSQNPKYNADFCLRQIDNAFKMRLPAIVSCHRLNFIGDLVPSNRDHNLKEFRYLLKALVEKYPDVEFRSSDEVFK